MESCTRTTLFKLQDARFRRISQGVASALRLQRERNSASLFNERWQSAIDLAVRRRDEAGEAGDDSDGVARLVALGRSFVKRAALVGKTIISELALDDHEKTIIPLEGAGVGIAGGAK